MVDERSPIKKLDDAVHDYFASIDDEGTLAGWVIGYQSTYIEDNGPDIEPITWDGSYALSPGISPFAAAGLAAYVKDVVSDVYRGLHGDEDEE